MAVEIWRVTSLYTTRRLYKNFIKLILINVYLLYIIYYLFTFRHNFVMIEANIELARHVNG